MKAPKAPWKRPFIALFPLLMVLAGGCDLSSVRDFIEERVNWFNRELAIYITSTYTGRVYRYDIGLRTAEVWFSTEENGTGAIYFHNDVGYVAVGATSSNPGLYRFDPRLATPVLSRIGMPISAQYAAFYGNTKAYVTDYALGSSTGVYTFDPSNPAAGLGGPIPGTDNLSQVQQHVIVGVDNRIYVSSYGANQVLQINPATDTVVGTWTPSVSYPQALYSEFSMLTSYVYVLCNPWTAGQGAVDRFQPGGSGIPVTVASGIDANKMVHHEETNKYYAVGYANTYVLTPATPTWTSSEIKDEGVSFGGSDILIHDDLVFVAGHDVGTKVSRLYVVDATTGELTAYSPVTIMEDGVDGASNLALY